MDFKKNLILGIGNPILCDDALGLLAVRNLKTGLAPGLSSRIDFKEDYTCGINILDQITGYRKVIIIDSMVSFHDLPGTCHEFDLTGIETGQYSGLSGFHGINLPVIWNLGKKLHMDMPSECIVVGIVGDDFKSFSETLSVKLQGLFDGIISGLRMRIDQWAA